MNTKIKAAVVQAEPVVFDVDATLSRVRDLTAEAAAAQARVVVFPEAFLGGYPFGTSFGTQIGNRSAEGKELYRRFHAAATEVPGTQTQELAETARINNVYLVVGVVERAGGTLFSSSLTFAPSGALVNHRRKITLAGVERYVWGRGDAQGLETTADGVWRLGTVIGLESYLPQVRMALYGGGINIYCAPTVDDSDTWRDSMRSIALEGRTYVLSACQLLQRQAYPGTHVKSDVLEQDYLIRGGSCIVDPAGNVLADIAADTEGVIMADLDIDMATRGKYDFDVAGHYSRPDVFTLEVHGGRQHSVIYK